MVKSGLSTIIIITRESAMNVLALLAIEELRLLEEDELYETL